MSIWGGLGSLVGGVGGFLVGGPAGAAAGASALGGLGNSIDSSNAVGEANATNIQLGREQMAFQERMSNSAYQRQVEDMRKAGINPMLAANMGGASTPQGSMPQAQVVPPPTQGFANSAIDALSKLAALRSTEATTLKTAAEANTLNAALPFKKDSMGLVDKGLQGLINSAKKAGDWIGDKVYEETLKRKTWQPPIKGRRPAYIFQEENTQ